MKVKNFADWLPHLLPTGFPPDALYTTDGMRIAADWWGERGDVKKEQNLRKAALVRDICECLKFPNDGDWGSNHKLLVIKTHYGFEIAYGSMYNAPSFNLGLLVKLGELLGTMEINVDNYSVSGCETCDFYSDYGHTLQIHNPTKHVDDLDLLSDEGNVLPLIGERR